MQKAIHGITVAHFLETYRDKLKMELVVGERGLHRLIHEGSINRPALALTGFFKYFANKRIQVLGAAEIGSNGVRYRIRGRARGTVPSSCPVGGGR